MNLTATIGGSSVSPLMRGSSITWDMQEKMSRARLQLLVDTTFSIDHQDAVVVSDGGTVRFTGQVVSFSRGRSGNKVGTHELSVDCADHVFKMTRAYVGKSYKDQSDRAILQDILSTSGLSSSITSLDANVDIIDSNMTIAFPGTVTVRQAFDDISNLTGGVWHLDGTGALHYNTEANGQTVPEFHLVDKEAQNAYDGSEDLNHVPPHKVRVTISTNATTAPNGEETADKVVETATTGTHVLYSTWPASPAPTPNMFQTYSLYAKAAGRTMINVRSLNMADTYHSTYIDLDAGSITSVSGGQSWITSVGNGWYHLQFKQHAAADTGLYAHSLTIYILGPAAALSYAGDASLGVYMWGLQFEVNSSSAGDYIYTPDGANPRQGKHVSDLSVASRFDQPANHVTVIGPSSVSGPIREVRQDAASQSSYGILKEVVESEGATTATLAQNLGDAILAMRAYPQLSADCKTLIDGIEVNDVVRVTSKTYGLVSKPFLVTKVTATQYTDTDTAWGMSLGPDRSGAERVIRMLGAIGQQSRFAAREVLGLAFDASNSEHYLISSDSAVDYWEDADGATISFWLSADVMPGAEEDVIMSKEDGWVLQLEEDGNLVWALDSSGGGDQSWNTTDDVIRVGEVYHILVVWNGGTGPDDVSIYVNGVDVGDTHTGTGTPKDDSGNDIFIGGRWDDSRYFDGWLSQLAIWNYPLAANARAKLYEEPSIEIPGTLNQSEQVLFHQLDDFGSGVKAEGGTGIRDAWGTRHGDPEGSGTDAPNGRLELWNPLP